MDAGIRGERRRIGGTAAALLERLLGRTVQEPPEEPDELEDGDPRALFNLARLDDSPPPDPFADEASTAVIESAVEPEPLPPVPEIEQRPAAAEFEQQPPTDVDTRGGVAVLVAAPSPAVIDVRDDVRREVLLPDDPPEAIAALDEARDLGWLGAHAQIAARLRDVVAKHPSFLDGWAELAAHALNGGDAVAGYAYARTGYQRGLDALRRHGWRGEEAVPWRHAPNRGFLRSVHALMRAAEALGEADEAARCRSFLERLDTTLVL